MWANSKVSKHITGTAAGRLIQIINQWIILRHCIKDPFKCFLWKITPDRNRDNILVSHYSIIKCTIYRLILLIQLMVIIAVYDHQNTFSLLLCISEHSESASLLPHEGKLYCSPSKYAITTVMSSPQPNSLVSVSHFFKLAWTVSAPCSHIIPK